MKMNGFRIRLNFAKNVSRSSPLLNSSEHGYWYYVDPVFTPTIHHVLNDLHGKFQLPRERNLKVFLDGLIVLPHCPVGIIDKDDTLKVKFCKDQAIDDGHVVNNVTYSAMSCQKETVCENENVEDLDNQMETDDVENDFSVKMSSHKRKRRRKKKAVREVRTTLTQCLANLRENPPATDIALPQMKNETSYSKDRRLNEKSVSFSSGQRLHIRFNDDGIPESYPVLSKEYCEQETQRNVSTYFVNSPTPKNQTAQKTKNTAGNCSSSSSSSSEDDSSMDDDDGGILQSPPHLGDPWADLNRKFNQNVKKNMKKNDSKAKAGILSFPPSIGDVISFKMLELSQNFTPEMSRVKKGRVRSVNDETKLVTFEMIDGAILMPNDDGENEPSKVASVSWSSLVEPQILSL